MPCFSIIRPCLGTLHRGPMLQSSMLIARRFSDGKDDDDDHRKIKSRFDDGLFTMKHGDKHLILSYWTPLKRVSKCLIRDDDDRKNLELLDGSQKLKFDDNTPLGTALQSSEKIVFKSKDKTLLLALDGSQADLKRWSTSSMVSKSEPIDELERKKNLLLQSYIPQLQNFEKILHESHSSSSLRFKWIGLFLLSAQLGFVGRLTWFEYSWDIMEPFTWCITYSATIMTFCYYVITSQEYQYPQAERRLAIKRFCESYSKKKFDLNSFTQLHQQIKFLEQQIQEMKQKNATR